MPLSKQALSLDLSPERASRPLTADELAELKLHREAEHEDLLAAFVDWNLAEDEFLATGPSIIEIALDGGYTPLRLALRDDDLFLPLVRELRTLAPDIPGVAVPPEHMEQLLGLNKLRGILAVFRRKERPSVQSLLAGARRVLVVEQLPSVMLQGNLARSAAALFFDAIVFAAGCGDPYGSRVVRGSMGNLLSMPWTVAPNAGAELACELRAAGFTLVRLARSGDEDAHSLNELGALGDERVALVIDDSAFADPLGAPEPELAPEPEPASVLAPATRNEADYLVRIPVKSARGIGGCTAAALAMWKLGVAGLGEAPHGRA